jgi:hypothetical protein
VIYRALSLGTHEEGLFESNCEVEKEGDREAGDYMITGKKGEKKNREKKKSLTSTTIVKARANVSGPRNTIGRRGLRLHNIIIILLWHGLWLLPHRRCLTSPSWVLHTWWIRGHGNNNNTSVIKSFSSARLILIFDDHASIVGNQNGLETQKNFSSARHRSKSTAGTRHKDEKNFNKTAQTHRSLKAVAS